MIGLLVFSIIADVPRKFPFCLVYDNILAFEPIVLKSDIFFIFLKYVCREMQGYWQSGEVFVNLDQKFDRILIALS